MAIYKICLALRETTERPDDRTELTFNAQTTGERIALVSNASKIIRMINLERIQTKTELELVEKK